MPTSPVATRFVFLCLPLFTGCHADDAGGAGEAAPIEQMNAVGPSTPAADGGTSEGDTMPPGLGGGDSLSENASSASSDAAPQPELPQDPEGPATSSPDSGVEPAMNPTSPGNACAPFSCVHGACVDTDGDGVGACVCERAYAGRDCASCAEGYVELEGECVRDECADLACVQGVCRDVKDGPAVCVCDVGATGALCETCLPGYTRESLESHGKCTNSLPIDGLVSIWYDAADASTVELMTGGVARWRNKALRDDHQERHLSSFGGGDDNRPAYSPRARGIEFDGNDVLQGLNNDLDLNNTYTVWLVASWIPNGSTQTFLAGVNPESDGGYGLLMSTSSRTSVRFEHRSPFAAGATSSEGVTGYLFDAQAGRQLIVARRGSDAEGKLANILSGGTSSTQSAAKSGGFPDYQLMLVGASYTGMTPKQPLTGTIHELIVKAGYVRPATVDAVNAYLRVKWGL